MMHEVRRQSRFFGNIARTDRLEEKLQHGAVAQGLGGFGIGQMDGFFLHG